MVDAPSKMLTLREVSDRTGYTEQQLRRLCREGKLPATRLTDTGRWLISRETLDALLKGDN